MKALVRYLVGAAGACLLLAAPAWSVEIVVKGLTEGSAILVIDGRLAILREGDVRHGVRLIHADNAGARVEVGGRTLTLELDSSIAETYREPEPERVQRAGSDILYRHEGALVEGATVLLSVKLVEERGADVTLGVEYVYGGDYGEEVYLDADTLKGRNATGHVAPIGARLRQGRHYVEINVASGESAPLVYASDALRLTVYWTEDGSKRGAIISRVIPFSKYWKKVRVR